MSRRTNGRIHAGVIRTLATTVFWAAITVTTSAQTGSSDAESAESIQQRIDRIETAADLDAETKTAIQNRYKSALASRQRLEEIAATDARYRQDARTIAERAQRLNTERLSVLRMPAEQIVSDSLAELEVELAARTVDVASLRQQLTDLEAKRTKRNERRAAIARMKEQAPARLAELRSLADAPAIDGEHAELTAARRLDARLQGDVIERELLLSDLELALSNAEEKAELIRLEEDIAKAKLARKEAVVQKLTERVSEMTREADEERIRKTRAESQTAHPLLATLAESNREAAELAARYPARIEEKKQETARILQALKEQEAKLKDLQDKEELVGLTQPIGAHLREERADFPDLDELDRRLEDWNETLDEARQESWRFADELASLSDPRQYVQQQLDAAAAEGQATAGKTVASIVAGLTDDERSELERNAAELLATRRNLLTDLHRASEEYSKALLDLHTADTNYLQRSREYLHYINERILWIRSADPLTLDLVRKDSKTRDWLNSVDNWKAVVHAATSDPIENPIAFWPTLVAMLALFYIRMSIRPRLRALGGTVGKRGFLRYGPTSQAAAMTLMSAVTAPAMLLFISWRLAEADDPTGFVRAVSTSIATCAAVLFPIELLRESFRHQGLAEAHFAWSGRAITQLRRSLTWMKTAGLPFAFLAVLAHLYSPLSGGTPTERLLFIGTMALATVTMHRLLAGKGEFVRAMLVEQPKSTFIRFRRLWYVIGVGIPIGFAGLSTLGYHYSATQVADRLLWTFWLATLLVLGRAMAVRWVVLSRRRLLLDQAYQRRAAEEQQDSAGHELPPVVEETDVAKATAQTRKLIDIVVLALAVAWLGVIWAETLPAFGLLDRELWPVETSGPVVATAPEIVPGSTAAAPAAPATTPESALESVTISDLAVAILVAVFTFLASRNLPGMLEMSVLTRLPFDNATRYAATRLASYAIVFLGVMMVSNQLGLRWQNIQWLAAALTVGLGFGLQEVFANFVSGLIILFERPVRVGDIVNIDGVTGVVSRIRMRATTITNWERQEFIVPNKEFITGRVLNWTLSDTINRISIPIGLAHGTDIRRATSILVQLCKETPALLEDPAPAAIVEGFTENAVTVVLRCFLPSYDGRQEIIHELNIRIEEEFRKAGIELARPRQDLRISPYGELVPQRQEKTSPVASESSPSDRERAAG